MDGMKKKRVSLRSGVLQSVGDTISRWKAYKSDHFTGHFKPKSGKRTNIQAYLYCDAPEFGVLHNLIRKKCPGILIVDKNSRRRMMEWEGGECTGASGLHWQVGRVWVSSGS